MRHKLKQISEHVWIMPLETAKDRPNLGYIKGGEMSLAVDAGHSSSHVRDFYGAIERLNMPLPQMTVLTHWHWDHTFGMHAVSGKTIARRETDLVLREIMEKLETDPSYGKRFLDSDLCIRKEYAGGIPLAVVPADELITGNTDIDLGGVTACLRIAVSPHTDDALLVYIPEDKVLFVGDAQLGEFPSWRMDYDKLYALTSMIQDMDVQTIIDGHWKPYTKQEYLDEFS